MECVGACVDAEGERSRGKGALECSRIKCALLLKLSTVVVVVVWRVCVYVCREGWVSKKCDGPKKKHVCGRI